MDGSTDSWYLDGVTVKERYWGTTTADAFVSRWDGGQRAVTKHFAQKHPGETMRVSILQDTAVGMLKVAGSTQIVVIKKELQLVYRC